MCRLKDIVAVPVFSAGHEGTLARYNGRYSKDYNWLICNIEKTTLGILVTEIAYRPVSSVFSLPVKNEEELWI